MTELELLARLIHAEAEGEPFVGKIAVGAVVVNRLAHPDFPNSISQIIYAPGQFSPVSDGRLASIVQPHPDALAAAEIAMEGEDPTGGALFFYNPRKVSPHSWIRKRKIIFAVGEHVFCE